GHSFTPSDGKVGLGVIYHRPSGGALIWRFPTDSGIAGIEIHPLIDVVSDGIHHDSVFLDRDLPVQQSHVHQNPSFRLPESSALSVRFKAWWSASSRCS